MVVPGIALCVLFLALLTTRILEHQHDLIRTTADLDTLGAPPVWTEIGRLRFARGKLNEAQEARGAFEAIMRFLDRSPELKVILLTSASPEEGKSTTAAIIAVELARSGKRVVLVDGDLRHSSLRDDTGQQTPLGLSGLLLTSASNLPKALRQTSESNLYLLPAGTLPADPERLLNNPLITKVIKSLRRTFDYVVIDSASVLEAPETTHLASEADATLLVARARATHRESLKEAIRCLAAEHVESMGIVLNDVSRPRARVATPQPDSHTHSMERSRIVALTGPGVFHESNPQALPLKPEATKLFGVDFSGAKDGGKYIWLTEGHYQDGRLVIDDFYRASDRWGKQLEPCLTEMVAEIASQPSAVVGFDFAFSLPEEILGETTWLDFITGFPHRFESPEEFRLHCWLSAGGHELRRRTHAENKVPYCVYNMRLFRQTYYGIRNVLAPLVSSGRAVAVPLQQPEGADIVLLEVSPASMLKRDGLRRPYKGRTEAHSSGRRQILDALEQSERLILPDSVRAAAVDNVRGDAIDSIISATGVVEAVTNPGAIDPRSVYTVEGAILPQTREEADWQHDGQRHSGKKTGITL